MEIAGSIERGEATTHERILSERCRFFSTPSMPGMDLQKWNHKSNEVFSIDQKSNK